jgi:hypothetical protein
MIVTVHTHEQLDRPHMGLHIRVLKHAYSFIMELE